MIEDVSNYLNQIRHEFTSQALNEEAAGDSPIELYAKWLEEAVGAQVLDPKAMVVSTVSVDGKPSSRVVYNRGLTEKGFKFYTNYDSRKGHDLLANPHISVNVFWSEMERQVRMEGIVTKLSEEESDRYFKARPRESQIGAWASAQSEMVANRGELQNLVNDYTKKFEGQDVPRPPHWGGYFIEARNFEFWQGRPARLHDRIIFEKEGAGWKKYRVAP
ncbi:MAG: pyridoxamine 5'-phosphate oxidase [Salibacteraceae bacterium]|jgi:pyridoxamine 5'-phosphate oxidase